VPRLPNPGGDDNVWGDILNSYLRVEHNSDGSLKIKTDGTLDGKYAKPATGIPASDLDAGVQSALNAAGTIPAATAGVTGGVRLAGDLGGTATAPTVPGLSGKVAKAGDTMTGKLVVPSFQVTGGASNGYVLTADGVGNASWSSIPGVQISGPSYYRGVSLSGLEFTPNAIPGTVNIAYFQTVNADFAYYKSKGLNLVRIPFMWDRIQPYLNGALDSAYKGYVDQAISYAASNGMKVVLDVHNYGRRYVGFPGGFTNDFTSSNGTWSGGSLSGGRYVSDQNTFFTGFSGGDFRNPVSPAGGYKFTADVYITNSLSGGGNFPALDVRTYDNGNNSYYQLAINQFEQKFKWSKVIGGVSTAIGEVATTVSLNTLYQVEIDINQGTAGQVVMKVNGSQIASFPTDGALTGGKITIYNNFTKSAIDNVTLNVAGDTTSGMASGLYRIGDANLPISAFADLWSKLATAYANNGTVWAYDLMNEPHDMPVPTTPSNYNTTATVTLMYQAAINAIRAADPNTYIAMEIDQWSGLQSFVSQYGSNPAPWWTDTSNRTILSCHYYFDSDHSGSYQTAWSGALRTRIAGEITPVLQWAQTNGIPMFVGEYGVPNGTGSDAVNWQQDENTFLGILDTYGVHASHWAGGTHYTASTTLEPFTSGSPDYTKEVEQMAVVKAHLGQQVQPLSSTQGGTGLIAVGTAGNVLTSDGTSWTSAAPTTGVNLETTTAPPSTNTTGGVLGVSTKAAHADHTHAIGTHDHSNSANGGNVYAPNLLTYSLQGMTSATRVETAPRLFFSTNSNLTSGNAYFSYFTPDYNLTVANFVASTGPTTPVGTITLARMGLYTVDGSNNLTCVARTANTVGMFSALNTTTTQAIADDGAASPGALASYNLLRGVRYAFAFIEVGASTAPQMGSRQLPNGALGQSLTPVLCTQISGQTDLAASYTAGSVSGSVSFFYGALKP
jgi:aryl-phospho-beta-D-glucosidase BglC (GH1 family)